MPELEIVLGATNCSVARLANSSRSQLEEASRNADRIRSAGQMVVVPAQVDEARIIIRVDEKGVRSCDGTVIVDITKVLLARLRWRASRG